MRKIFKYQLEIVDYQIIDIKRPAISLSVAEQYDGIVMYAMVDDNEESIPIDVRMIGTGHPIKDDIDSYKFLGTVKLARGELMFHVFTRHSKDFIRKEEKKGESVPILRIDEFINIKEKDRFHEIMIA